MNNYYKKYVKYKRKYLKLKGGSKLKGEAKLTCQLEHRTNEEVFGVEKPKILKCNYNDSELFCIKDNNRGNEEIDEYYLCQDRECFRDDLTLTEEELYFCNKYYWLNFGYGGFENIGNTCYGNSFLQPLCFTYPITFEYMTNKKKWKRNDFINRYISFLEVKFSRNEELKKDVMTSLHSSSGESLECFKSGYGQQDSSEFLTLFIDKLITNELNLIEGSKIEDKIKSDFLIENDKDLNDNLYRSFSEKFMFNFDKTKLQSHDIDILFNNNKLDIGYLKDLINKYNNSYFNDYNIINNLTYKICTVIYNYNKEWISVNSYKGTSLLQLPLIKKAQTEYYININDCIDKFFNTEKIKGYKIYEETEVFSRKFLLNLPNLLFINIKRLGYDDSGVSKNIGKLGRNINMIDFERHTLSNDKNTKYILYGFTVHIGGKSGGHYVSYVKIPIFNLDYLNKYTNKKEEKGKEEKIWIKLNDSAKIELTNEDFLKQMNEGVKKILYYKKIDDITHPFPFKLDNNVRYTYKYDRIYNEYLKVK